MDGIRRVGAQGLVSSLRGAVDEFARRYTRRIERYLLEVTLPALFAGQVSPGPLIPKKSDTASALPDKLRRDFIGNHVVENRAWRCFDWPDCWIPPTAMISRSWLDLRELRAEAANR